MGTRSSTASVSVRFQASIANTLNDGTEAGASVGGGFISNVSLDGGVSANESNRGWFKKSLVILSGNFKDINLSNVSGEDIGAGSGLDALGQQMDIEEIVCLLIECTAGPGELEIMSGTHGLPGAAPIPWIPEDYASNSTKGGIKAGGVRMWFEPGTDGLNTGVSSGVIRLSANGGDVTADILVIGRHDDDESSSSSVSSSSTSTSSTS